MAKKGIIDRFEEDWAVIELEDGSFVDIPMANLPPNAVEGTVVLIKDDELILLSDESNACRQHIHKLVEDLFED